MNYTDIQQRDKYIKLYKNFREELDEEERNRRSDDFFYLRENPVRSLDYVEHNCKKLVNQIEELRNEKDN